MEQKQRRSEELDERFRRWRDRNRKVDRFLLAILLGFAFLAGSALVDNLEFLGEGMGGVRYHDFDELLRINPDTVAWLKIERTHIDHPVVKGKDNFEYLDKAFTGEFYAGGTLFLDCGNERGLTDPYNIIHGHNMAKNAMFSDLEAFLKREYFASHKRGTLLTPSWDYDLAILAVGRFDAYDPAVYGVGSTIPHQAIREKSTFCRMHDETEEKQILALSTCSGAMNDDRIVLFCEMTNRRAHE